MAEVVGLVASIITLTEAGLKISKLLYSAANSARDVQEDIAFIAGEMTSLSTMLDLLNDILQKHPSLAKKKLLDDIRTMLSKLRDVHKEARELVLKKRNRIRWVMQGNAKIIKDKIAAIKSLIDTATAVINLALTSEAIRNSKHHASSYEQGRQSRLRSAVEMAIQWNRENILRIQKHEEQGRIEAANKRSQSVPYERQHYLTPYQGSPNDSATWLYHLVFSPGPAEPPSLQMAKAGETNGKPQLTADGTLEAQDDTGPHESGDQPVKDPEIVGPEGRDPHEKECPADLVPPEENSLHVEVRLPPRLPLSALEWKPNPTVIVRKLLQDWTSLSPAAIEQTIEDKQDTSEEIQDDLPTDYRDDSSDSGWEDDVRVRRRRKSSAERLREQFFPRRDEDQRQQSQHLPDRQWNNSGTGPYFGDDRFREPFTSRERHSFVTALEKEKLDLERAYQREISDHNIKRAKAELELEDLKKKVKQQADHAQFQEEKARLKDKEELEILKIQVENYRIEKAEEARLKREKEIREKAIADYKAADISWLKQKVERMEEEEAEKERLEREEEIKKQAIAEYKASLATDEMMWGVSAGPVMGSTFCWKSPQQPGHSELHQSLEKFGWKPTYVRGTAAGQTWYYGDKPVHAVHIARHYQPQVKSGSKAPGASEYLAISKEWILPQALDMSGIEYHGLESGQWMLPPFLNYRDIEHLITLSMIFRENGLRLVWSRTYDKRYKDIRATFSSTALTTAGCDLFPSVGNISPGRFEASDSEIDSMHSRINQRNVTYNERQASPGHQEDTFSSSEEDSNHTYSDEKSPNHLQSPNFSNQQDSSWIQDKTKTRADSTVSLIPPNSIITLGPTSPDRFKKSSGLDSISPDVLNTGHDNWSFPVSVAPIHTPDEFHISPGNDGRRGGWLEKIEEAEESGGADSLISDS